MLNQYNYRIGIVVPLANEEDTISLFIDKVLEVINDKDVVICVFDTVCTDRTREIVKNRGLMDDRIIEIYSPENRCVVDAYFRGYQEALYRGCEWILEMDGGMSHDPQEINRFIKNMKKGVHFIAGSRFLKESEYRGSLFRKLLSQLGTHLTNFILGTKMRDMTSGFECFSNEALRYVLRRGVESRAHFFQTEIRHMLSSWPYIEIPISYKNPSNSVKLRNIIEALNILFHLRRRKRINIGLAQK